MGSLNGWVKCLLGCTNKTKGAFGKGKGWSRVSDLKHGDGKVKRKRYGHKKRRRVK